MKITLEIDCLNEKENKIRMRRYMAVDDMASSLFEIQEFLRSSSKYSTDENEEKIIEKIRNRFNDILTDNDIYLETLRHE